MKEKVFMKGYKVFNKGMVCHGKQYAENTVFEEDDAIICRKGMHFCVNPMDCMNYYSISNDTEFAEVEALAECVCEEDAEDSKYCTTKLRIGKRLSFDEFIDVCVEYNKSNDAGDNSKLVSSGHNSNLASSGYHSKLVSSGRYSNLASSGYDSNLASSGKCSDLASSGNYSDLASSGNYSNLASSGQYSNLASSGYRSKLASSGDFSNISSSGYSSVIMNAGVCGCARGVKGTWITLAEYNDEGECICVKSAKITGRKLKENTWYTLKNGEFVEAKI